MKYYVSLIILVIMAVTACQRNIPYGESSTSDINHIPSKKGVCWVGGDSIATYNFDQLHDVGGNWISQTPFAWQDGIHSPDLISNTDRAWWGEADRGLIQTAQIAKTRGIKTMLKPHIWIRNANGKWRAELEMKSDKDWDEWFFKYESMILHYAKLAEEAGIEALCIGTELYKTTIMKPEKWRAIIGKVRKIYSGELTYAANWYKEFEEITFWDELDYIGVQAYFPLSRNEYPEKSEILREWNRHKKQMSNIASKYDKKIVFTEIGYKNTSDSAKEPWTWPQNMDKEAVKVSDETQIMLYESMFESLFHETWVDGFFIWKWFHTTHRHQDFKAYFKAREARYDSLQKAQGWEDRPKVYFTPQQTKAIEVLNEWYHKQNAE